MKFKKVTDEGNVYGYELIEIIQFNYNGSGSAIAKLDGELDSIHKNDLPIILFGDPGSGDKYYQLVE